MEASRLHFFFDLAKGIARQFGQNCEVVVHDLESNEPDRTIVAIENGHVTGRKVGDGPSQTVLQALQGQRKKPNDHLAFLTKTRDGKVLRCSTIFIPDEDGNTVGILEINYDISLMLALENGLRRFTVMDDTPYEAAKLPRNVSELLEELIEQSVALVGKPTALMTKEEKVQAIRFLNDAGAFLITKSGDKVCKYFGISKYTLYSYIDEAKA